MATPIVMPKLGVVMSEGIVAKWTRSLGDSVTQGDIVAEIETEKLNYDLEATGDGIFHPMVKEGATVAVDGLLGYLLADGEAPPEPTTATQASSAATPTAPRTQLSRAPSSGAVVASTPGARRLAAKLGVELSQVTPTGPRGRVTDADVRAHADGHEAATVQTAPPGLPTPSKVVPIAGMRKAIAEHMRASVAGTAQLSFFLEVDVTEATQLRREASRVSEVTLATAHFLIKACAEALKRHPDHNTTLSDGSILYFDEINIGLAVALNDGLIVPVVKNVQDKDLRQVAQETNDLATRARDGTLLSDDVAGGTFTVSVLGTVDGFTPILNQGQSAILGAGRSTEKPVVQDGKVVVRQMMTLSLTVDHQVIDGAVAAGFLRRLQRIIERPAQLFR